MESRKERYDVMSYDTRSLIHKLYGSYQKYLAGSSDMRMLLLEDVCAAYEYSKQYPESALAGLALLGVDPSLEPRVAPQLLLFAALSSAIDKHTN